MTNIHEININFLRCFENAKSFELANKTSDIPSTVSEIINKTIPSLLSKYLNNDNFIVNGSVGKGLATKTPWVAILDKDITESTREGVYIVFLFSSDYKHVYLTFNQGTTVPGQFGPRLRKKEIAQKTLKIRKLLNIENELLLTDGNASITDERYLAGAIYYSQWNEHDDTTCKELLDLYLEIYRKYKDAIEFNADSFSSESVMENNESNTSHQETNQLMSTKKLPIDTIIKVISKSGLLLEGALIKRLVYSLLTKPFVILSGLAGSGKTQLALALAKALVKSEKEQMCVVPVGADWTNREPLLGYPNALKQGDYVKPESGVLDLLIECNKPENSNKPYFLILDEMNLSYVERYFADFLSAMESHEAIPLWNEKNGNVEPTIDLPKNLFIIGTINVDETTYMFSPKVLDRANVIEFKVDQNDMNKFLDSAPNVDINKVCGKASLMAADFVQIARNPVVPSKIANDTLKKFFAQLKKVNAEFGYRTATEIGRFISLAIETMDDDKAIDAAIVQKLMPKLHGSRKKIVPVLKELWTLCGISIDLEEMELLEVPKDAKYPLTADKIVRMYKCAIDNGFTSFAEA